MNLLRKLLQNRPEDWSIFVTAYHVFVTFECYLQLFYTYLCLCYFFGLLIWVSECIEHNMDSCRISLETHPLAEGHHAASLYCPVWALGDYEQLLFSVRLCKAQGAAIVKHLVKSQNWIRISVRHCHFGAITIFCLPQKFPFPPERQYVWRKRSPGSSFSLACAWYFWLNSTWQSWVWP